MNDMIEWCYWMSCRNDMNEWFEQKGWMNNMNGLEKNKCDEWMRWTNEMNNEMIEWDEWGRIVN